MSENKMTGNELKREKIKDANLLRELGWTYDEISKELEIAKMTAYKYVNEKEKWMEKTKEADRDDEVRGDKIEEVLKETFNVNETAERLGISYTTLRRILENRGTSPKQVLQEEGIELKRGAKKKTNPFEEMAKDYEELGTLRKVAEKHGVTHQRVSQILRENGMTSDLRDEKIDRLHRLIKDSEGLTVEDVAEKTGYHTTTVKTHAEKLRVELPMRRDVKRKERLERYLKDLEELGTARAVAKKNGESETAVIEFLRNNSEKYRNERSLKTKEKKIVDYVKKNPDFKLAHIRKATGCAPNFIDKVLKKHGYKE